MRELLQKTLSLPTRTDSRPQKKKRKSRGQSLVEMTLTLPLILFIFSGLVEFGFMLNYYLSLLDATRYAARDFANASPFTPTGGDNPDFYYDSSTNVGAVADVLGQLNPRTGLPNGNPDNSRKVALDPATDDVIVSVFSVVSPTSITTYPADFPYHWNQTHPQTPYFTEATLQSQLVSGAPCQGVLVVEVAYTYHQILNLPWMAWLGSPVLHAYTVMPLQAAEPISPGSTNYTWLPVCQ